MPQPVKRKANVKKVQPAKKSKKAPEPEPSEEGSIFINGHFAIHLLY